MGKNRPYLFVVKLKTCASHSSKHHDCALWHYTMTVRTEHEPFKYHDMGEVCKNWRRFCHLLLKVLLCSFLLDVTSWGLLLQRTILDLCHLAGLSTFASAARAPEAVVALLWELGTTHSRQIAHKAWQHKWNGRHEGPACTAVWVWTGTRLVGAGAFLVLILCAVVEHAFY